MTTKREVWQLGWPRYGLGFGPKNLDLNLKNAFKVRSAVTTPGSAPFFFHPSRFIWLGNWVHSALRGVLLNEGIEAGNSFSGENSRLAQPEAKGSYHARLAWIGRR